MIQYAIIIAALGLSVIYLIKKFRKELSREAKGCDKCELKD